LITIGAYQKGGNAALDQAVALYDPLRKFLRQGVSESFTRQQSFEALKKVLS
jgi:flagellum-specific ATP synthase